jgi:hypothetical protein
MAANYRNLGVVGFVLSVGIACTQLFGGEQNTLAPRETGAPPAVARGPLEPGASGPAAICETGQMRCDGAQLQTCADDRGSWVTVQRCGAAALCQPSPAMCLAATCSAEEMTCSGALLQKCNADRTGWDLFATCLSPAHCNADLRQCSPEPCNPGDRRCDRSDSDQSPVLEVCRDDRSDWGSLDACVTRELCDQTLTSGSAGGLELGADGMVQVQAPATPEAVVTCNLPACAVGEVRCDGARLEYCSEGRTGWITAEECASAALCSGSLTNVGSGGTPVCLPPVCAVGQHNCTEVGVLQVCSDDRTGFIDQETCIDAPFCNAVLADLGQAGCRDAPCEAGQMQCNGAQIQVCRDDRTALDDVGAPCESAALCNADDPSNAFCDPPVCRRGATSGDEFHCEGALLQRCNESLTAYDTIETCVTAALCDASQRADGCKTPVCEPGQHACNGGFLQTCNADQTGFGNTENCGSQAQCDANAGRCADPCELGSQRCNATNGDLEQCNDLLTGWQPIADCPNAQLCDLANGRCDICLDGAFSCADNQLRQCAPDGRTFSRQNIPAECALAANGGGGVRACRNNQVVVNPCPLGCTNGRCHECSGTEQQCLANGQIRRCVNGFFANPTSCSDGNACNGVESCQNNNCVGGQAPNCNDGNACTNDTCNPTSGCQASPVANRSQCVNGDIQSCTNGNASTQDCGAAGCNTGSTSCNACAANTAATCLANGQRRSCVNGQFQNAACGTGLTCQGGVCAPPPVLCTTGTCTGNQFTPCVNGQPGAPQTCPEDAANNQCVGPVCSAAGCGLRNLTGEFCISAGTNGECSAAGTCVPDQQCTPNSFQRCLTNNLVIETCNATGTGTVSRTCTQPNQICSATAGACITLACTAGQERCSNGVPQVCRADRTGFQALPACEGSVRVSCPTATGAPTRFQCNRDNNSCTFEGCRASISGAAGGECFGTALSEGTACTTPGGSGQCGNLDAVCHLACTSNATCPLATDACTGGLCVPGCNVTGCGPGLTCNGVTGRCFVLG